MIFQNRIIAIIADLSMEIYLCHMFIFRMIEKSGFLHLLRNEAMNYFLVCLSTIVGAILMSFLFNQFYTKMNRIILLDDRNKWILKEKN